MSRTLRTSAAFAAVVATCSLAPSPLSAERVRARSRTTVHKSTTHHGRHGSTHVTVNKSVDVHHHGRRGCCYHDPHPVARAATVAVTAAVVGSVVRSLPPDCNTIIVNGLTYQQCGSTWYQPQTGSTTTYIVVNDPH